MMFARASSVFVLALPVLAAANVLPRTDGSGPSNQCNTGSLQCCNSTATSASQLTGVAGLLAALLGPITGIIGVTCSPITVIGASGTSCNEQPVCCTNNSFNGVIALGCTPININV
ncbi:fungal hydrophobin [Pholiota conissans]|uniref:Hydrophobin n=1 Tax=Pholiota conissans TaxID=109636 RepID=A0A9P5ZAQ6_9AGAR|nr:fungal hydrophobin [Pholiota conissans]